MMAALRTSRRSTQRKRYTNDPFEGVPEWQDVVDSESDDEVDEMGDVIDGDVDADAEAEDEQDDDDEVLEDLGPVQEVNNEEAEEASDAGEQYLEDDISIAEEFAAPKKGSRVAKRFLLPEEQRTYTRGLVDALHNSASKSRKRAHQFGPTEQDQAIALNANHKWGYEICFPSRKVRKDDQGGFAYSAAYKNELRSTEHWNWRGQGGGKEVFAQWQKSKSLYRYEARDFMPVDGSGERTFVMGAVGQQKIRILQPRQAAETSETFEKAIKPSQKFKEVRSPDYKSGFVLNLGVRPNCLDWAPNHPGSKQYLAVSVLPEREKEQSSTEAPSFSRRTPYKSSIQVWEFTVNERHFIDKTKPPRLATVACMEVGDIRDMKWCLSPPKDTDSLGLLAVITYDGGIRVLNIYKPSNDTSFIHINNFAFQSQPTDTVFTCLTWLSSARLAAGCANGFVAVWDIPLSLQGASLNARPSQYLSIGTSYILSITSGYASHPNMLMTTSASGHIALTDLSSPFPATACGTALAPRVRLGQPLIAWSEFGKTAISVEDNLTVKGYPLRRWFTTVGLGRIKSQATAIATSPCHPFVLIGTAGGGVTGLNPIRRIVDGGKNEIWQQDWFRHEWRRPTEEEEKAAAAAELSTASGDGPSTAGPPLSKDPKSHFGKSGVSRFVEGFKAEKITLGHVNLEKTTQNHHKGTMFKTLFEAKTAITALAWNPNLHVAGWAAAGMADGLVRIEDIAAS